MPHSEFLLAYKINRHLYPDSEEPLTIKWTGQDEIRGFFVKKTISPAQGKIPSTGIFLWKLNLSSTGTEFHTQGNFEKLKVPTHHSTNTVERNMALLLLSCIQILFWNMSFFQKYIGLVKSMRLILCERKRLNIGFHLYTKFYAGILFQIFCGTCPVHTEHVPYTKKQNLEISSFVDVKSF